MTDRIQYKSTKIKNYFNLCLDNDVFGAIFTSMDDEFTVIIKDKTNEIFKNRLDALEYLESEFKVRYWSELYLSDDHKFTRPRFTWV